MKPWQLLDIAQTPDGNGELRLNQRDTEFSIRIDNQELMNSRMFGSEEVLAEVVCQQVGGRKHSAILIGGLGMGFTLAAALRNLGKHSRVVVCELVPAVVEWNLTHLGHLSGHPLRDHRVRVEERDISALLQKRAPAYDGIILDVDNGPEGLTQSGNDWLYSLAGLYSARECLRPKGVLAVWSARPNPAFSQRFAEAGFEVEQRTVRARRRKRGPKHTIWIGTKV